MTKLVLIDGSGYIFRAFYALPPMTRADGTPTGAVFGFTKMLMKILKTSNADYFAVIFDAARKNFRNDIFPDYKGTRKDTPPELIPQFPLIREAVRAFNVPAIEEEGYEADDLIAAYAKYAQARDIKVKVVSSDKDMMQLLAKGVSLFDPMKNKDITEVEVKEKFGVPPAQVLDVMALIGDSSDNVPGVSGFGPKTAAELILKFGTLDNLLASTRLIKQAGRRQTLEKEKDLALLSRRLITLAEDAPLPEPLENLKVKAPDCTVLENFAKAQNFISLESTIKDWCTERTSNLPLPPVPKHYELITTPKDMRLWISEAFTKTVVAIDTETTGLNPFKESLVGISISTAEGRACYIPLNHCKAIEETDLFGNTATNRLVPNQLKTQEVLSALAPLFAANSITKIGHNIKYDMHILARAYKKEGLAFSINNIGDTMLMAYVLYGGTRGHSLDELAKTYLDYDTISYKSVCGEGRSKITFATVSLEKALDYAAEDADITLRLYRLFAPALEREGLDKIYKNLDNPLLEVLFDMEEEGVSINKSALEALSLDFTAKLSALEKQIFTAAGKEFNPNSPAQLGAILFEDMGIKGGKKGANGFYSTDSEVLENLASNGIELARLVLQYRALAKLKSTYTDALVEQINSDDNRVHTTFSQTVTSTGRLSSVDPNLQNIPIRSEAGKKIRSAFIAPAGKLLVSCDYSQVELRLMAGIADVKGLKEAFKTDIDIHALTASAVFSVPLEQMTPDIRRKAKAINFGIIYGISAFGLARQIGVSNSEAAKYINAYFLKYPEIKTYMERTIKKAQEQGYVTTITGRRCYIDGINSRNPNQRGFAERAAINAPIQGSAADLIKKAMLAVPKAMAAASLSGKMLLQVHDELVLEVPEQQAEETAKLVKRVMETTMPFPVALTAEAGIGKDWGSAH